VQKVNTKKIVNLIQNLIIANALLIRQNILTIK